MIKVKPSVVKDCPLVMIAKRLKCEPPTNIETTVKVYSVVKDCSLVMIAKRLKCEPPTSIETTVKAYSTDYLQVMKF